MTFTDDLIEFCKEVITLYKDELVSANTEDVYKIEQKMTMLKDVINISQDYDYNDSTRFSFDAINTLIRGIRKVKPFNPYLDIRLDHEAYYKKIQIFKDDILFFGKS